MRSYTMTWNYRIVKHAPLPGDIEYLAIHEAYYDKRGDIPSTITMDPVPLHGETLAELTVNLEQQSQAFDKSVLNYEDF